jgi:hypothetical protein
MGEPGVKFVDRDIPASRATRAERWLGIIQREIEDKLIAAMEANPPAAATALSYVAATVPMF